MDKTKNRPPMVIRGTTIKPTDSHRFLGVLLDEGLRWHKQVTYAVRRGTAYVLQLRRISLSSNGIPLTLSRQLYMTVALPKKLYAVNLWFRPIYTRNSDDVNRGSLGTSKRLGRVQRFTALAIMGALSTTAGDAAEAHTKLIPIAQRIQILCHRAALRLAAHPSNHPLHPLIRRAAKRYVKHHRSSLHHLSPSKEDSIHEHNNITTGTQVYTDGSGTDGKIGASAVLYAPGHNPRTLCYHLGTDREHTVYEVEVVGMTMVAHLILTERDPELPINIFVNNQAAIKSGDVFTTKSGHYLID
ncbi:hypothetical protein OG21DRAFT_1478317 [Imleria badia]|nr:hypothetical protein OG21DRAFT_1478317 [Imleria badia]